MHSRQAQLGSKLAPLPPGAQPPTASRHRQTQPSLQDDFIPWLPSHRVDHSAHGSTQVDDEEQDGSYPQPPGKPAQPPRDMTKEELQRTKAKLHQLEYGFRRAKENIANMERAYFELDGENRRNKDTIRSLQHEVINMGHELQEYKNLSDVRGRELIANQISLTKAEKLLSASERRGDLEFTNNPQTTPTNNEESLSAARAIVDGTGATPVMAVIDAMLVLHKEIANVSNFLAENIRHTSYELLQEELDRCYQDSEGIIGERLSKSLHDHAEAEELSQSLIKITFQIFITSFCASEWDCYLDAPLHVGKQLTRP
jgi:hypothetical protein